MVVRQLSDRFGALTSQLNGTTTELRRVWCRHRNILPGDHRSPQVRCPGYGGKLRAAETGSQILIGVRGEQGRAFTISLQQIVEALASTGRAATVSAITMSAHSRGNAGLAATLAHRLIPASLIDHITVLDGTTRPRRSSPGSGPAASH